MLQIFQPVRKTDLLHKPNFYSVSFHLVLFCPYCVKVISHNKGCLPVTQSMKVNNWSVLCWEDWLQHHQCNRGFGPVSRPFPGQPQKQEMEASPPLLKAGRGKESEQSWPQKCRPVCITNREIFLKGRSRFRGVERSVVNVWNWITKCLPLWLGVDSLPNEVGSFLCTMVISLLKVFLFLWISVQCFKGAKDLLCTIPLRL